MASDKSSACSGPANERMPFEPRSWMLMSFIYDTSSIQERLLHVATTNTTGVGLTAADKGHESNDTIAQEPKPKEEEEFDR
ncbi:hypothetical protein F66182_2918 [Fusarium sp. NRRL 66182]|nr:hypothetical protein F66182_2918 [Fusarium sp. NRRL 66182]